VAPEPKPRRVRGSLSREPHRRFGAFGSDDRGSEGTRHCLGWPSSQAALRDRRIARWSGGCSSNFQCGDGSRTSPADADVLRPCRITATCLSLRSRRPPRHLQSLSPHRHRGDRPVRRICRQIYGRRGARLFRLPAGARGRRRAGGSRGAGHYRRRGAAGVPRRAWPCASASPQGSSLSAI